ncbi:MAG: hypothetical protein OXE83_13680 [Gammaproteobacteria bacterium]|nr:hypothetical protein [Gammaproteobacteria bacterium]
MPAKKPFPLIKFSEALDFAKKIASLESTGRVKRLTLLDQLQKSAGSSKTRTIITHSSTYGLTKGGYQAEFIQLTEDGRVAIDDSKKTQKHFDLAISRIGAFDRIFKKYAGKSIPNSAVLQDTLEEFGISYKDVNTAMSIFRDNLRYVGAIVEVSGTEHIDMLEFDSQDITDNSGDRPGRSSANDRTDNQKTDDDAHRPELLQPISRPQLHIDVQVHIDSSATAEQIDQVFKSMATHLYGNRND